MYKAKQKFVPFEFGDGDVSSFAALVDERSVQPPKAGSVISGVVVKIIEGLVVVDIGGKNEGYIPVVEFRPPVAPGAVPDNRPINEFLPKVGDVIEVYVDKTESDHGYTLLSRAQVFAATTWAKLKKAFDERTRVTGFIKHQIRGGFVVDIDGVAAFLPGSQVDIRLIRNPQDVLNTTHEFYVLKIKVGGGHNSLVVSRRAVIENERAKAKAEVLASIAVGDILTGIVKNITDYGAFIEFHSMDGLLHVSDIAWRRVNHPSELLSIGMSLQVKVIHVDQASQKVQLGLKQMTQGPWDNVEELNLVGKTLDGKIINISEYGIFIELTNGLEGFVPVQEISWSKGEQSPRGSFTIGTIIDTIATDLNVPKRQVLLSIKRLTKNPWTAFSEKHAVGSVITCAIRNITNFAIFVGLDDQIDGIIHVNDIAWDGTGVSRLQNYKKNENITCKILSTENERVSLGIKQLVPDPFADLFERYAKLGVESCVVSRVSVNHLDVLLDGCIPAIIKKIDISEDPDYNLAKHFKVNSTLDARVVAVDRGAHLVFLSLRAVDQPPTIEKSKDDNTLLKQNNPS